MSSPYSICIIDDYLPWNKAEAASRGMDERVLTAQDLKFLLENAPWDEESLKDLVKDLLSEPGKWDIKAFVNPKLYLAYSKDMLYFPEMIVFDWNFSYSAGEDSKQYLKSILSSSSAAIGVFTNGDNVDGIERIISQELGGNSARIKVVEKGPESCKQLIQTIEKLREDNFTVRYGKELRSRAAKSLEGILAEFSQYEVKKLVCSLGALSEGQYELSTKELTDAIVEKLRNALNLSSFADNLPMVPEQDFQGVDTVINEIWRQRLYYSPKDNIVRRGDIIWKKDEHEKLYLIINNDCDFEDFWKKNHGFLTVVPLEKMAPQKGESLRNMGVSIKNGAPSSLTNFGSSVSGKYTVLPFIKISESEANYLLNPKAITCLDLKRPAAKPKKLLYDFVDGYDYQNRYSVSEPFLTPLIQFVLTNISGYGVPDYPKPVKTYIKEDCQTHGG